MARAAREIREAEEIGVRRREVARASLSKEMTVVVGVIWAFVVLLLVALTAIAWTA